MENRDVGPGGNGSGQTACIADILSPHEHIDVLPDLALFVCDTIPKARVDRPQSFQRFTDRIRGASDLDPIASTRKGSQGAGYVEGDRH
jgi:hypothetical protein